MSGTCTTAINGCRWEEYTASCAMGTGIIQSNCCYGECGTPL
jgi:hypothetical protein